MRRRGHSLLVATVGVTFLGVSALVHPAPSLVWNASASAPLGLYGVARDQAVLRGDLLLVEPPDAARRLASERGYLPADVPLVKRVAALPGDTVCGAGLAITINGRQVVERLSADSRGRPLPAWEGCRVLRGGEVFLLMEGVPELFRRPVFRTRRGHRDHRETRAPMDLVTLFAACALGSGMPWQPTLCPVHIAHVALAAWNAMDQWEPLIAESSRRFGVPESWIRSAMRAESGGQTMLDGRPITSRAGAMGLMQVMPETYEEMRLQLGLGRDPYDPRDNVLAGAAYLREMYDRYGYPGLFAAYNAGPDRYDDYLIRGRTLPQETLRYLAAISPNLRDIVLSQGLTGAPSPVGQLSLSQPVDATTHSGTSLFFALSSGSKKQEAGSQTMPDEAHVPWNSGPLFVPLRAWANGELPSAMAPGGPAVRATSQHRYAPSGDPPVSHGNVRVVIPSWEKAP